LQNKLLEAMAMKLPCITSPLAGNPLAATHNTNIIICDNVEEYVQAVTTLLAEKTFYKTISENGLQFVKRNYDWEEIGKKLKKLMNNPL
jgi:glycosyltransferase involved in cell wall biosynthesis